MKKIHGYPLDQVFREAYLAQLGATFAEFQANPQGTLENYGQHDAIAIMRLGYRPLLPVQVRLRKTLEAQWRAEGTWDESTVLNGVSPAPAGRFFHHTRQAMSRMLALMKQRLPKGCRLVATQHPPSQAPAPL